MTINSPKPLLKVWFRVCELLDMGCLLSGLGGFNIRERWLLSIPLDRTLSPHNLGSGTLGVGLSRGDDKAYRGEIL